MRSKPFSALKRDTFGTVGERASGHPPRVHAGYLTKEGDAGVMPSQNDAEAAALTAFRHHKCCGKSSHGRPWPKWFYDMEELRADPSMSVAGWAQYHWAFEKKERARGARGPPGSPAPCSPAVSSPNPNGGTPMRVGRESVFFDLRVASTPTGSRLGEPERARKLMRNDRKKKAEESKAAQNTSDAPYAPFANSREPQAQVSSPSMDFKWTTVTRPKSARKGGSRLAGPALNSVGASRLNM